MDVRDRFGLEHPVVQAGMGGGVAGGPLAGAVSAAGALGTVGIMAPKAFAHALQGAVGLAPGRPVAANLLAPFTRRAHVDACIGLGVVHDYIARMHADLVRVLPERRALRSYWIVVHEDVRGLGRIRAVHDHLVRSIAADRDIFLMA